MLFDYFGEKCIEYDVEQAIKNGALIRYRSFLVPQKNMISGSQPGALKALMDFYGENKRMDKPILVKIKNGRCVLKDNFLQYYV